MLAGPRRWLRRNRNTLLVGAGVVGAGYLAGQYVLSKISEARQRMSEEKRAKEKYVAIVHHSIHSSLRICKLMDID